MVKLQKAKQTGARGPSSAIGIMTFAESSKTNLMLSPYFVIAVSVVFAIVVLFFKHFGA